MLVGLAIRVVRTRAHPLQEDLWRRAKQDHMLEAVVETPLVLHGEGGDQVGVSGQPAVHAALIPSSATQLPPVVVGVGREVAPPTKFVEDGGLFLLPDIPVTST